MEEKTPRKKKEKMQLGAILHSSLVMEERKLFFNHFLPAFAALF